MTERVPSLAIAGTFRVPPQNATAAANAMQAVQAATHEEAGCIRYVFSADLVEAGVFRLYEEWESQAALEAHFETDHIAAFGAALAELDVEREGVHKLQISSVGPVR